MMMMMMMMMMMNSSEWRCETHKTHDNTHSLQKSPCISLVCTYDGLHCYYVLKSNKQYSICSRPLSTWDKLYALGVFSLRAGSLFGGAT